jgi:hypothetical protein
VTARRAAALLLALVAAACGGDGPSTPRDALAALRSVLLAGDGPGFVEMIDSESRSRGAAEVRERRAMMARGDEPAKVIAGLPLTPDELMRGDETDTIALFFPRRSPLFKDAAWISKAELVGELNDGPDEAAIDLRGDDGVERRLWFVKERGAWRFDSLRTRKDWR